MSRTKEERIDDAWEEYDKKCESFLEEYKKKRKPLREEFEEKCESFWEEYKKKREEILAEKEIENE